MRQWQWKAKHQSRQLFDAAEYILCDWLGCYLILHEKFAYVFSKVKTFFNINLFILIRSEHSNLEAS